MRNQGSHHDATSQEPASSGFIRMWPHDDNGSGFGVAAHISATIINCRLFDLETKELLGMESVMGDFETLSKDEINNVITDLFFTIASNAGVKFSKVNSAVISGSTALECAAAGLSIVEHGSRGRDMSLLLGHESEYIMVGPTAIAVGEAFYAPCVSPQVGGDVLCAALALDALAFEKPILFVELGTVHVSVPMLACGNKDGLTFTVLPDDMSIQDGIDRLLDACAVREEDLDHVFMVGEDASHLPASFAERAHLVGDAIIAGTSAVLLSEVAEDELCRIADNSRVISL